MDGEVTSRQGMGDLWRRGLMLFVTVDEEGKIETDG